MTKQPTTKQAPIKNGKGEITGHITLHWSHALGWVSIPKEVH
jgi:hypothetical protein